MENPETFIEDSEATFPRSFDDRMKTRLPATWWSRNRTCITTWDSFKNLLWGEFNSKELIASLRSQLYGEKTQQHEDARNFIQYRRQIALGPLRQTRFIKHDIVVTDPKPFRLPPYRYSAAKKKTIQEKRRKVPFLRRFSALKRNHGGLRTALASNPRSAKGP
jgi:hypothetical protein